MKSKNGNECELETHKVAELKIQKDKKRQRINYDKKYCKCVKQYDSA